MLFKTTHGSHLYGLAHANSDHDYYVVVNTRRNARAKYARQSIVDGIDTTVVDFGTWVNMCQAGVPQALEAVFAPARFVEVESSGIAEFRNSFRVGEGMRDKYFRTIENFIAEPDFKKNRHALRLCLNLRQGRRYGYFNPTLPNRSAIWITHKVKTMPFDELREYVLDFANG
jgi:predicted nucleotidyltransferase